MLQHGSPGPVRYSPSTININDGDDLVAVIEVLSQLRHFGSMDKILQDYLKYTTSMMAPIELVLELLSYVRALARKFLQDPAQIGSLAQAILLSSSQPISINPETTVSDFCKSFSHRLETIGLMFACTAQACLYRLTREEQRKNEFAQRMMHYSNKTLALSRKICPELTDVLMWFMSFDTQVISVVDGDLAQSYSNRRSNTYNAGLEFGLHQPPRDVPFFLQQCRCFMFVSIFRTDKVISALSGQAPLLPGRICSSPPPLDLNDWEILHGHVAGLRPDGWNIQNRFDRSTLVRLRHTISVSQDAVLQNSTDKEILRVILDRHQTNWNAVPDHLKDDVHWEDLSAAKVLILFKTNLIAAHLELQIHTILDTPVQDYLYLCTNMLDIVLKTTKQRTRASNVATDLPAIFLHSIAPVKILATTLRDDPNKLPDGLKLIRKLSVYVHELEVNCGPGRLNNSFCLHTLEWLPKLIDEVLGQLVTGPQHQISPDGFSGMETLSPDFSLQTFDGSMNLMDPAWETFLEM